jgi:enamine deaminase RidA (YjgF/YER057c/UK114 family)
MTPNATTAEDRLARLGIHLPDAPTPFGAYVPAVQTGNLLFLSGMLATSGHAATVVGIVGKDLDVKAGRAAAYTAALNVLALIRKQLGSLDRVSRVVRLGVYIAATAEFTDLDLGEVEQVVDDAQQAIGRRLDRFQALPQVLLQGCVEHGLGHAEDGVHGGADLVADVGQELVLGPVGRLHRP